MNKITVVGAGNVGASTAMLLARKQLAEQVADAIVKNRKRILPCSAWLDGESGLRNVFWGTLKTGDELYRTDNRNGTFR